MIDFRKILWFDKVYDLPFKKILPLFQKLNIQENHTIACGAWYFVNLMNQNGIFSSGSDISSWVLQVAENRYPHIDFSIKDIRDFSLEHKVELITCMDGCINHVFSTEEIEETFISVYKNLKDIGYFYFEFWTEKEVSNLNDTIKKEFKSEGYDISQKERRLENNIHNMLTVIKKDENIVDILNAYHTSFPEETVLELLSKVWFKKTIKLSFSTSYSKKILAFKY